MSSTSTGVGDPPEPHTAPGDLITPDSPSRNDTRVADPGVPSPPDRPHAAPRSWRPLMLRLHFYAGVLVGPFILIAAITGALYAMSPMIEKVVYSDVLTVEQTGGAPLPLSEQVSAAQSAYPGLTVLSVQPPATSTASTRIHFADPGLGAEDLRAVFVDPYTGSVLGSETSWMGSLPFSTWVDVLHRDLHLGPIGNLYSEIAASWLWVVALGGLFLWWAKFRKDRVRGRRGRLLGVDRSVTGRARTLNWHGATGVWILVMLLFLSATGITWSPYAGEHVTELRSAMSWERPSLSTSLAGDDAASGGEHAAHGAHQPSSGGGSVGDLDQVARAADQAGVQVPIEITLPTEAGQAISVSEIAKPYRLTTDSAAIDPTTMQVTATVDYNRDYSLMAKLADWGIRMHMGILFGLLNQLLLLAVALLLITIIIRGYRMWWQRRPTRGSALAVGRPPLRGGIRRAPVLGVIALAVAAVAVGWFLPLLGITLVAFLVLDVAIGAVMSRRRRPSTKRTAPTDTTLGRTSDAMAKDNS